jgi:lipoyl(octanoyl) transferase
MSSVDYGFVWKLQKGLMSKVLLNRTENVAEDYLILVEHTSCYTLGKSANLSNIKNPNTVPSYQVERGGDVTYHGPGQLILYPIFDLTFHRKDLHWWVISFFRLF